MKKLRLTLVVTSNKEWFDKNAVKMKADIESGEAKKQFMTLVDIKEGIRDVEVTFEDISK